MVKNIILDTTDTIFGTSNTSTVQRSMTVDVSGKNSISIWFAAGGYGKASILVTGR